MALVVIVVVAKRAKRDKKKGNIRTKQSSVVPSSVLPSNGSIDTRHETGRVLLLAAGGQKPESVVSSSPRLLVSPQA